MDIRPLPYTIPLKEEIVGVIVQDMEVYTKKSPTCPYPMLDKVLMALGEVDLGLGPALFPPIIQAIMVDRLIFVVMVITEVDIGIPPAKFLHITMVD